MMDTVRLVTRSYTVPVVEDVVTRRCYTREMLQDMVSRRCHSLVTLRDMVCRWCHSLVTLQSVPWTPPSPARFGSCWAGAGSLLVWGGWCSPSAETRYQQVQLISTCASVSPLHQQSWRCREGLPHPHVLPPNAFGWISKEFGGRISLFFPPGAGWDEGKGQRCPPGPHWGWGLGSPAAQPALARLPAGESSRSTCKPHLENVGEPPAAKPQRRVFS